MDRMISLLWGSVSGLSDNDKSAHRDKTSRAHHLALPRTVQALLRVSCSNLRIPEHHHTIAAMAAASQALGLSTSFASLSVQEPHKKLATLSSSSSLALRCNALRMGVAVGKRTVVASPVVRAAMAEAAELESPEMEERRSLEAWVKQQLPGGFAAARLIGTGRRKTAVARVVLVEGTGKIVINNRTAQDYLQGNPLWLQAVKYPLASLGYETKYDIIVRAEGGGLSAQAQAILLGVARALIVANQANRDPLKKQGLLTRDSRIVERKKYGLHKARKAPQYSKR